MLYKISYLYVVTRREIKVLEPSDITPEEFRKYIDTNTRLYVAVHNTQKKKGEYVDIAVDYSHLITDQKQLITDTWEEFTENLTEELAIGYAGKVPGYSPGSVDPINQVVTWDVMNTLNTFDVNYADYRNGYDGIYALRWTLHDLRISIVPGASPFVNLENCLPIVNGVMCRPIYRRDKGYLYAQNGAKMAWQEGAPRTPEVQLIDFTNIGKIKVEQITHPRDGHTDTKTHLTFMNRQNMFDMNCAWKFTVPYSLYQYSPILVIAGIPIFPDQYRISGEHEFVVSPYAVPLNHALQMIKYFGDDPNTEADITYETDSLAKYIEDRTDINREEPPFDMFIVFVETSHLYVNRIPLDVWDNNITLGLYAQEGMLLHNATGSVRVYHTDTMSDRKELTIQNLTGYLSTDMKFEDKQYGAFPGDKFTRQNIRNIMKSDCTMVHLMGES